MSRGWVLSETVFGDEFTSGLFEQHVLGSLDWGWMFHAVVFVDYASRFFASSACLSDDRDLCTLQVTTDTQILANYASAAPRPPRVVLRLLRHRLLQSFAI